jgi:hypothetical protein
MRKQQQRLVERLLRAAETMGQGGLSETSRRCGNTGCICYRDPERLHGGPHLYITYREDGKSRSLYVPSAHAKTALWPREPMRLEWGSYRSSEAKVLLCDTSTSQVNKPH